LRVSTPVVAARRTRAVSTIVAIILALGLFQAPSASAEDGYRLKLLRLLNASREKHGLDALRPDASFNKDAMHHTRRMLRRNEVFDPSDLVRMLSDEPWEEIGASVVGCASTLKGLHRALMQHRPHREILLHPDTRRVGIGVVKTDTTNACHRGYFWATELFYG
jgi:uncharacterized protein YkwD